MLNYLTNYLLQYKTVSVPGVGTLCLVHQPPRLNVADKLIEPPSYVVEIKNGDEISDHQLLFLSGLANKEKEAVENELHSFGNTVQQKINSGGFNWEGLGIIKSDTQMLSLAVPALQPLAAERVIRQDAKHTVLVGDREVSSARVFERSTETVVHGKKRAVSIQIGWILLFLSLLVIALLLYLGKFSVNASGSKLPPTGFVFPKAKTVKL
ncbi:hypothetical protein [Flavisolibacter ginsenosidimutans]|uniref:CCDC81-like prokaryotic HU domain-containing protein n=1 Tax=Flavisolibacter ginsenosidimutans TaxID=661481 RepID=A0A5B8UDT1_9BACT|nr:hypothetical protein [Flavisolibacter ginsenosidimutans]QEC54653.1 hypothetical protein FSB75_01635 [Flavisolibacter ginsenosidimutans]